MKQILKPDTSLVILKKIKYRLNGDNSKLTEILKIEQNYVCAYTETRITSTFSVDIDHFNPKLKTHNSDSYTNWFVISTKLNRKKNKNWDLFQPILHPSDPNFEQRIWYNVDSGEYEFNSTDNEAANLDKLIGLNRKELVDHRKKHINLIKYILGTLGNDIVKLKKKLSDDFSNEIQFYRALETAINGLKF